MNPSQGIDKPQSQGSEHMHPMRATISRVPLESATAQSVAQACRRADAVSQSAMTLLASLPRLLLEPDIKTSLNPPAAHLAEPSPVLAVWERQEAQLRYLAKQMIFLLQIVRERAAIDPSLLVSIAGLLDGYDPSVDQPTTNLVWERRRRMCLEETIGRFVGEIQITCDAVAADNIRLTAMLGDLSARLQEDRRQVCDKAAR